MATYPVAEDPVPGPVPSCVRALAIGRVPADPGDVMDRCTHSAIVVFLAGTAVIMAAHQWFAPGVSLSTRVIEGAATIAILLLFWLATRALRRRVALEDEVASLSNAAPTGIFRIDARGACIYANARFLELTGGDTRAPGDAWLAAIHPDDRDDAVALWEEAFANHAAVAGEHRLLMPDGSVRWVLARCEPQHDRRGRFTGYLGMLDDVTASHRAQEALRASEELHRLTVRNLPSAMVALYDRGLRCILIEGRIAEQAGFTTAGCRGRRMAEFVDARFAEVLEPLMREALDGQEREHELTFTHGEQALMRIGPYHDATGEITGVLIVAQDVTAVREAERRRRDADRRFRVAFDRAPIGMLLVGLNGQIQQVNPAFADMTGHQPDDADAFLPARRIHPDDRPKLDAALRRLHAPGDDDARTLVRLLHADGRIVFADLHAAVLRDDDGRPEGILVQALDVTEHRQYERHLRQLADHDPLTGLLNRRAFTEILEDFLRAPGAQERAAALFVLDLDAFKFINDTLGHAKGDEILLGVSAALHDRLRRGDVIARLGGDEFAVLLPDLPPRDAARVAESLVEVIRDQPAGTPRPVTASIGVVPFVAAEATADELLVRGDLAMYDAKEDGRDRIAVYGAPGAPASSVESQMTWLDRLTRALARDGLTLHAQPVVDLASGEVRCHEVLVRMIGDDGELISPAAFLGVAERHGLAPDVDRWVLEHALDAMAAAAARGRHLPLAVNLSGASTCEPSLLELISRRLHADGICAGDLTIEITETTAVADIPRAATFAHDLQALGCRLALDDFGAGYGALTYLKHLPFDVVKLDGEYVKRAARDRTDERIVAAVANLARDLGKETVAEFVPDDDTIALLLELGVTYGQGFHLGRPFPLDDLLAATLAAAVA